MPSGSKMRSPRKTSKGCPAARAIQLAFLDKNHCCGGRDRLGHRGDAEDRVASHRIAAAEYLRADCVDVHLIPAAHQADDAGNLTALDIAGHHIAHTIKARFGQSAKVY
jgi:hypothetical protein